MNKKILVAILGAVIIGVINVLFNLIPLNPEMQGITYIVGLIDVTKQMFVFMVVAGIIMFVYNREKFGVMWLFLIAILNAIFMFLYTILSGLLVNKAIMNEQNEAIQWAMPYLTKGLSQEELMAQAQIIATEFQNDAVMFNTISNLIGVVISAIIIVIAFILLVKSKRSVLVGILCAIVVVFGSDFILNEIIANAASKFEMFYLNVVSYFALFMILISMLDSKSTHTVASKTQYVVKKSPKSEVKSTDEVAIFNKSSIRNIKYNKVEFPRGARVVKERRTSLNKG